MTPPPSIQGLDHLQLAIPKGGEDEARAFYGDLLGLIEVPKPDALAQRGGVWFAVSGIALHLGVDPTFVPAKKAHPAFLVDDLASFLAQLEKAGYEVVNGPEIEGYRRFHTHDPFGNRIELMQRIDGPAGLG